jgi:hypothetical protein
MPNTKVVRSMKKSGFGDGGVPSQGLPKDSNTTYPVTPPVASTIYPEDMNSDMAANAPINQQYYGKIPTTVEPLHSVNLAPVSLGGKKS